jgi:hypothetical protein
LDILVLKSLFGIHFQSLVWASLSWMDSSLKNQMVSFSRRALHYNEHLMILFHSFTCNILYRGIFQVLLCVQFRILKRENQWTEKNFK